MARTFIISDAHLGAQSAEREGKKVSELLAFLDFVKEKDGELIICGDLFDFWFEYRHAVPRLHFRVITKLSDLVSSGVTIHYVAGNHDFWLDSFLHDQVGMTLHHDEYVFDRDDKKYFVKHGDGLQRRDHLYRLLKRVLRNRINIFLYRLIHPDLGVPIALFFSHLSRNSRKDRPGYSDSEYRQFAFAKIDEGYDFVILGHTHWPALEKYKQGWYLNAGSWLLPFSFIVIEDSKPEILRWDRGAGVSFETTLPPGNTPVQSIK
jgi:UDP-2,3-diacylglucosamine hydrolase